MNQTIDDRALAGIILHPVAADYPVCSGCNPDLCPMTAHLLHFLAQSRI
jgi:hypothetical protein